MKSYKSFISSKLFENLEESQIKGLIECEDAKIVVREGGANWNEATQRIDFNSNLKITHRFTGSSLKDLPFSIGEVNGDFTCSGIDSLKSLEGSPSFCLDFDASRCDLRSLKGSPELCANFSAKENLLKGIEGAPEYIFGDFDLSNNMIKSLNFGPLIITGTCKFLGNMFLKTPENGESESEKFRNMHRKITFDHMIISGDNKWKINIRQNNRKTLENVKNAIADKSYFLNLILEDPEYSKFLGRFQNEIDQFNYVKKAQDLGII